MIAPLAIAALALAGPGMDGPAPGAAAESFLEYLGSFAAEDEGTIVEFAVEAEEGEAEGTPAGEESKEEGHDQA